MSEAGEVYEEMTALQGQVETRLCSPCRVNFRQILNQSQAFQRMRFSFLVRLTYFSNLLFSYCSQQCFFFPSQGKEGEKEEELGRERRKEGREGRASSKKILCPPRTNLNYISVFP